MSYDLFTEYRYAGRNSPFAVIIPVEERGDEVLVTYKSAGARRKVMETERVNDLLEKSLLDDDVSMTLVEQKQLDPELCEAMDSRLEANGGSMSRQEWEEALAEVRESL